jgi:hypothetical protein
MSKRRDKKNELVYGFKKPPKEKTGPGWFTWIILFIVAVLSFAMCGKIKEKDCISRGGTPVHSPGAITCVMP